MTGVFTALVLTAAPARAQGRERILAAQSWGYQLHGQDGTPIDLAAIAASPFDLVVTDFSDGDEPFTAAQVAQMKRQPSGKSRVVLAYLSIGEAENYRFYWKPGWRTGKPSFVAEVNPSWAGNFKVRYWTPEWQRVLFGTPRGPDASYLDRILEAGFDGVYLDIIDAFEYFGPEGKHPERKLAAQDMAELVGRLAGYAREKRGLPGFLVVPQNGANILDELSPTQAATYLGAIDGIGAEDTFFFGSLPEDNPLKIQHQTLGFLDRYKAAGKAVLSVDYLTDKAKAESFVALARKHGFVPYVGVRELDRLVSQPPGRPLGKTR